MPGSARPSALSALPLLRPWLDSTRPMAATRFHGSWQSWSAFDSSVSARRYAYSAADGMPFVDSVESAPAAPARGSMPGVSWTEAGCSKALDGTSGMSLDELFSPAVARPELVRAAPHAPTSSVMGTSALAFCHRVSCRARICSTSQVHPCGLLQQRSV